MDTRIIRQTTCRCIQDFEEDGLKFHKGREYQVDISPIVYTIYQNGMSEDYINLVAEVEFEKYFELID